MKNKVAPEGSLSKHEGSDKRAQRNPVPREIDFQLSLDSAAAATFFIIAVVPKSVLDEEDSGVLQVEVLWELENNFNNWSCRIVKGGTLHDLIAFPTASDHVVYCLTRLSPKQFTRAERMFREAFAELPHQLLSGLVLTAVHNLAIPFNSEEPLV